jgi:peptidoglycan/xylan/chitin deacetylase (PgdA/CDA1 family)
MKRDASIVVAPLAACDRFRNPGDRSGRAANTPNGGRTRRSRGWQLLLAWLLWQALFGGSACASDPADDRLPQCGSQAVLERLWTPEQLHGTPADGKTARLRPADHAPPDPLPADVTLLQPDPASPLTVPAGSIRRVVPRDGARLIALAFDLCERADQISAYDAAVVDFLRAQRVAATFFAGGKWMRTRAERAMQLIADPLFEVGNHAWTHGNLRVLSGKRTEEQIVWTQQEYAALRRIVAERATRAGVAGGEIDQIPALPAAFRFPYGVCSPQALQMTKRLGLAAIQWDVISGDATPGTTAPQIVRGVLAGVKPGSIVVFHANGRSHGTAEALPEIVRALRAKGYRFVTVSELLRSGDPVATDDCYELRPGDNRRYDRLFGEGTG